jgi:chitinase
LREVSQKWDVINVAFGETAADHCTVQFIPDQQTESELQKDISYLKGLGKKVVLSIGGQNAVVSLPDGAARQKFVNSIIEIILVE